VHASGGGSLLRACSNHKSTCQDAGPTALATSRLSGSVDEQLTAGEDEQLVRDPLARGIGSPTEEGQGLVLGDDAAEVPASRSESGIRRPLVSTSARRRARPVNLVSPLPPSGRAAPRLRVDRGSARAPIMAGPVDAATLEVRPHRPFLPERISSQPEPEADEGRRKTSRG
jgi:hypothetical protein